MLCKLVTIFKTFLCHIIYHIIYHCFNFIIFSPSSKKRFLLYKMGYYQNNREKILDKYHDYGGKEKTKSTIKIIKTF